jgi:hypothetical protein
MIRKSMSGNVLRYGLGVPVTELDAVRRANTPPSGRWLYAL